MEASCKAGAVRVQLLGFNCLALVSIKGINSPTAQLADFSTPD